MQHAHRAGIVAGLGLAFGLPAIGLGYAALVGRGVAPMPDMALTSSLTPLALLAAVLIPVGLAVVALSMAGASLVSRALAVLLGAAAAIAAWVGAIGAIGVATGNPY